MMRLSSIIRISFCFMSPGTGRSGVCNFAVRILIYRCLAVVRTWFGIEVVVDCLCTEWFDDSYVQRLQALRSWGKGSHDFTPHELFVYLLMITGYTGYTGLRPKMMFQYCLMWRQSRWVGECNRPVSNSAWRVFSGWIDNLMGTKNCINLTVGCVDVIFISHFVQTSISGVHLLSHQPSSKTPRPLKRQKASENAQERIDAAFAGRSQRQFGKLQSSYLRGSARMVEIWCIYHDVMRWKVEKFCSWYFDMTHHLSSS